MTNKMHVINRIKLVLHSNEPSDLWETAKTEVLVGTDIQNIFPCMNCMSNIPIEYHMKGSKAAQWPSEWPSDYTQIEAWLGGQV